jgi:hypothetical protein
MSTPPTDTNALRAHCGTCDMPLCAVGAEDPCGGCCACLDRCIGESSLATDDTTPDLAARLVQAGDSAIQEHRMECVHSVLPRECTNCHARVAAVAILRELAADLDDADPRESVPLQVLRTALRSNADQIEEDVRRA